MNCHGLFFQRKGQALPITRRMDDYLPGDIVSWDLGGGVPHIGIVVDQKSPQTGRYMIVHNIGQGPKMEDVIFNCEKLRAVIGIMARVFMKLRAADLL